MSQLLSYDALPPDTDLSREFTDDGLRIIATAVADRPSPRTIRWARRMGAGRAIIDCIIVSAIAFGLTLLLPAGAWRSPNLPRVVFPIIAVFVAAIYLLAWKFRTEGYLEELIALRRQITILNASPDELRIEISGPQGDASHCIAANDVLTIEPSRSDFRHWWNPCWRSLQLELRGGVILTVLSGRDWSELQIVAAMLRRILAVPERVLDLPRDTVADSR